jgi:hypothetical protein
MERQMRQIFVGVEIGDRITLGRGADRDSGVILSRIEPPQGAV